MTTIAYRAGILAADTRSTDDGYHPGIVRCEKLFRVDGDIIATAGDDAPGMVFVDWYPKRKTRKPPTKLIDGDADFCCLVLTKEGLLWYDKWCRPGKVMHDFYSIGSGASYAMGRMDGGASAYEAVETAMKYDCYTGGEIVTMTLGEAGNVADRAVDGDR